MRALDVRQLGMFCCVSVDARVPADHPIRKLRELVDGVIAGMDSPFEQRYAKTGRPSISPERLLRASLLQVVYSVRSEGCRWSRSAISDDIAGGIDYAISQQVRKRIEQPFGWSKVFGGLRKLMRVVLPDVNAWTLWVFSACNPVRIGGLEDWREPAPT
ncbi:MAG TPA: hypothetical protein VM847_08375 [Tahibacter sp.]|nr:hypothetical protein [Tahibacter sp.]